MKKRLVILLVLAALLSGCIDRQPPTVLETIVYTPIAAVLRALNPGDAIHTNNPKEVVRLYYVVWEHDR